MNTNDSVLSAKFDENKIGRKYNITLNRNNERITGEFIRKTPSNNGIIIRLENNAEIPIQFHLIHDASLVTEVEPDTNEYILKGGKKRKRKSHKRRRHKRRSNKRKSHTRNSHTRKSHTRKSHKRRAPLFRVLPKKHSQHLLVDKEYKQFGSLIPGLRDL
jgi:hypothetical protein